MHTVSRDIKGEGGDGRFEWVNFTHFLTVAFSTRKPERTRREGQGVQEGFRKVRLRTSAVLMVCF